MGVNQAGRAKRMKGLVVLCVLGAVLGQSIATAAALSTSECESKGFTGLASCADCELFASIVKDDELVADCKACCVKEAAAAKYSKAVLELCPFRKSGLPQVTDFIKKRSKEFGPRLTIKESVGSYPRLVLSDPTAGRKSVRIDNWKTATIAEFLQEHLAPAEA